MSLVSIKEISKDFGIKPLFNGLTLVLKDEERVALIGRNGCGKSTLLRMIAGLDDPDSGEIVKQRGLAVAYVPQQDSFDSDKTVRQTVFSRLNAHTVEEHTVIRKLTETGFTDLDMPVQSLSGGWKKRLSLICALLSEPTLLLLDEPTNHLDTPGILWLEEQLAAFSGSSLFVSHDRYFIERLASRTVEIDIRYQNGFISADGGYSALIEKREQILSAIETQRRSLQNKVRREVEWLRQGVKARTTKAKYRIDEAHRLIHELNSMHNAEQSAELAFGTTSRRTKELLKADKLSGGYPDKVLFKDLSIVLYPGTRLGVVGANGTGKTTLLRTFLGEIPPLSGKVVRASNLKINFFGQMREQLDPDKTLKESLSPDADSVVFQGRLIHVVSWAQRFLFRSDQLSTKVGELSGGEQARLLLARVSLLDSDVLVFDEPTNDLDIQTLEVLEESFISYPGAIIVVSHDRYLLDRACTTIVGFVADQKLIQCADYTQFEIQWREAREPEQKTSASTKTNKGPGRLSYNEQKELATLERKMNTLETKKREIEALMHEPHIASNLAELQKRQNELAQLNEELEKLFDSWSALEEKRN